MESSHPELVERITLKAGEYLKEEHAGELKSASGLLLEEAVNIWLDVDNKIHQTRMTRQELREYLVAVIKDVTNEIVTTHPNITAVTLSFATDRLLNHLATQLNWTEFDPFILPLGILSSVIYTSALKILKEKL